MINNKRKMMLIVVGILLVAGIAVGVSYAWWSATVTQEGINSIQSDCLQIELQEENPIALEKSYPITDEEAESLVPYVFTIQNVCNTSVIYDVNLEVLEVENRLKSEYVAIKMDAEEKNLLNALPGKNPTIGIESYRIGNGTLKGKESKSHSLKIWMDEHVTIEDDAMNKNFQSKVVINASLNQMAETYKENILNGADPVLASNLIPIEIDDTGKVTKANTSEEWYSYANKKWANAVILEDETKIYQDGEEIPESNIESYFVWIPKYSYELWDLGEYNGLTNINESKIHEIPIKFGLNNTSDANEGECTTPGVSGESGNCELGDYMTHPAFLAFGTNGLWVGKFESGYKGATSTTSAEVNSTDASKLRIKPNVYSWRSNQLMNCHQISYNYQRELDSHLMKNTEWGAVAYLQHSAYGSASSVRINNNNTFITGYASVNEPTCGYSGTPGACNMQEGTSLGADGTYTINYFNSGSQVASTTGNYTGIYDMSGGNWEFLMSVGLNSDNSNPLNDIESKYYDIYENDTSYTTYNRGILGDATAEMGPFGNVKYDKATRFTGSWYKDEAYFIYSEYSWFARGGTIEMGLSAGIFAISHTTGSPNRNYGFRTVLTA